MVSIKTKNKKRGFISIEVMIMASLLFLFTAANVPKIVETGIGTYEKVDEDTKSLVYEKLDDDLNIFIDTSTGDSIHKDEETEGEILPPQEGGDIEDGKAHVADISVTPTEVFLDIGDSLLIKYTLTSTIPGVEIANKGVTWATDNKSIVQVSQDGTITAIAPGSATISVRTHDNNKTAYVQVNVNPILATDIEVSLDTIRLQAYSTYQLIATVVPTDATNQECIYAIEDESIASIDAMGVITAKNPPIDNYKTYVIVRNGNVEKRIPLEVEGDITPSEDIVLEQNSYTVEMGKKVLIKASVLPTNATVKSFNYYSQDPYYATVDGMGYIFGQNEGQTYVDVCNPGADFFGKEICRSVLVNVKPGIVPITSLSLSYDSPTIQAGEVMTPNVTFGPSYTTQRALEWSSSNPSVISVDDKGGATALKNGKATITATSISNPNIKASYTLEAVGYVIQPTSISIKENALQLTPGQQKTLTVEVLPTNAANKGVNFSSTDSSVAAVDANGNVVGIREGSTIITATTKDGGLSASIVVTVLEIPVESVSFDIKPNDNGVKAIKMDVNEILAVGVTINPTDASDKELTFTSTNPDAANYENGYVITTNYGIADITVIAANGKTDTITVEVVEKKPTSIKAKENPITITVGQTGIIEPIISPEEAKNKNVVYNFTNNTTTVKNISYTKQCKVNPSTNENICNMIKQEEELEADIISLDENGNILGLNPGTATVDITAEADLSVKTEVVINVLPIKSEKIEIISNNPVHFKEAGEIDAIEAIIYPTTTSDKELLFFAENNGVVSVDNSGTLTALAPGEATVTVVSADSAKFDTEGNLLLGESIYATVKVIVEDTHIGVTSLTTPDEGPFELKIGSEKQLIATIEPTNATDKNLSWMSSDSSVAVVNPTTGLVTAVGRGTAFITVSHNEGFMLTFEINVYQDKITKFNVTPIELILREGETGTYSIESIPTILSNSAYNISVLDAEDNPSDIVSVDKATQKITALKEGKAYVTFDVPDYIENDLGKDNFSIGVTVYNNSVLWDGVTVEKPTIENGSCIIKSAANLAWVSKTSQTSLPCTTLDFKSNVNLNGHSLQAIGDKTNGLALNILGNGHSVENGTIKSTGTSAGFISSLTNENAFVKDFKLKLLTFETETNVKNIGILAGTSKGINIDKVTISDNKIDYNATATPSTLGYIVGAITTDKNIGISNTKTMYNFINNTLNNSIESGGLFGTVAINNAYLNNLTTIENTITKGEFISSINAKDVRLTNFRAVNQAYLYQSLLGTATIDNLSINNFYLALLYDDYKEKTQYLISNGGIINKLEVNNGYYESTSNIPLTPKINTHNNLVMKTTEEMLSEKFVDLLNLPVEYLDWKQVIGSYPELSNNAVIESITLLNDKLVLFTGVSSDVNIDTTFITHPDSIMVEKVACTSLDTSIVTVDEKTCVAQVGATSGETKIRVTVNDIAYDDITVTSLGIGNEYGTPSALTPEIESALVRDKAAGKIEYELPTPDTWVAKRTQVTTMMSGSDFQNKITSIKSSITSIEFVSGIPDLSTYVEGTTKFDVSQEQNGTVYAWIDGTEMKIGAINSKSVEANKDSSSIFREMNALTVIKFNDNLDTSNITNMSYMFGFTPGLTSIDVSNWNTSNVTNMCGMFFFASSLTNLDISNWNTNNVTDMEDMFGFASSLTSLDVSNWDTSSVTEMSWMFNSASSLTNLDVSNWNTSNVTNMRSIFESASSLTDLDVSNWNTSNVTNMRSMFNSTSSLTNLDVSNWNTSNVTNMRSMFASTSSLTSIDVSNFDTSKVTNMYGMFESASSLTSIDVSNFDTSKVTNMYGMFESASSLTSVDVSNFDTGNVTNMRNMFAYASNLTSLDVSNWNTSNVTTMQNMFSSASSLTSLDISNWNTDSVTDMNNMFASASSLTSLDVSNWNTSNVIDMSSIFDSASSLISVDVSNWNTSNVINMSYMFFDASSLTNLDISKWNTSSVTHMYRMFSGTYKLSGNLKFKSVAALSNVINHDYMFSDAGRDSTGIIVYPSREAGTMEDIIDKMITTKRTGNVQRYQTKQTITTDLNGGNIEGVTSVNNFAKKKYDFIALKNPTKPEHAFDGWDLTKGSGIVGKAVGTTDPTFKTGNGNINIYNNSQNGNVIHTRQKSSADNPTDSDYEIKIESKGPASPSFGGFYQITNISKNKKYIHTFNAKLPVGYYFNKHANSLGEGAYQEWLTPNEGTGKWETYAYETQAGSSGSFSDFGFIAVASNSKTVPFTWYLASSQIVDIGTSIGTTDSYFHRGVGETYVYNNQQNGSVVFSREAKSADNNLNGATHEIVITTNGAASPASGGFTHSTMSKPNKTYIHKFIAKAPIGSWFNFHSNPIGDNPKEAWISSNEGTGEWKEYSYQIQTSETGDFRDFGYIALNAPQQPTSVSWRLAYTQILELNDISKDTLINLGTTDPSFITYFGGTKVYNNLGNGNVVHSRINKSVDNPTASSYEIKIDVKGIASPALGGFYQLVTSGPGKRYIHTFIAKVPKGLFVEHQSNEIGNEGYLKWITPTAGTGKWETYSYIIQAGSTGNFSTFGHVNLHGSNYSYPFSWNLAYSQIYEIVNIAEDNVYIFGDTNDTLKAKWEYNAWTPPHSGGGTN